MNLAMCFMCGIMDKQECESIPITSLVSERGLTLHMPGHELGHFKHADLRLAVEHFLERIIGIDVSLVRCILKFVLLDVVPKLLGQFTARQWCGTDDGRKHFVRLHWFQESGVRLAGWRIRVCGHKRFVGRQSTVSNTFHSSIRSPSSLHPLNLVPHRP